MEFLAPYRIKNYSLISSQHSRLLLANEPSRNGNGGMLIRIQEIRTLE